MQLQAFYVNEVRRGFAGIGGYRLKAQYSSLLTEPFLVDYIPAVSPEDIVTFIRDSGIEKSTEQVDNSTVEKAMPTTHSMLSSLSRARILLSNDNVSYDSKLHVFNVKGTASVHVVTLFPNENCTCPSTTVCYHIVAAKLFLGMEVADGKPKKQVLTQLRRNVRKKLESKGGRKHPCLRDVDIIDEEGESK